MSQPTPQLSKQGQELLDYLNQQFPSTVGHIPLKEMIGNIYWEGYYTGNTFLHAKTESCQHNET